MIGGVASPRYMVRAGGGEVPVPAPVVANPTAPVTPAPVAAPATPAAPTTSFFATATNFIKSLFTSIMNLFRGTAPATTTPAAASTTATGSAGTGTTTATAGGLYLSMPAPVTQITWTPTTKPDFYGRMTTVQVPSVASDNRPAALIKAIQDYRAAVLKGSETTIIFSGLMSSTNIMLLNMPDQVNPMLSQAYLGRAATAEELAHYKAIGNTAATQEIIAQGQKAYLSQFPTLAPADAPAKINQYMAYVASLMYWTAADKGS